MARSGRAAPGGQFLTCELDGEVVALVPDLISVLESETGRAIGTVRDGARRHTQQRLPSIFVLTWNRTAARNFS